MLAPVRELCRVVGRTTWRHPGAASCQRRYRAAMAAWACSRSNSEARLMLRAQSRLSPARNSRCLGAGWGGGWVRRRRGPGGGGGGVGEWACDHTHVCGCVRVRMREQERRLGCVGAEENKGWQAGGHSVWQQQRSPPTPPPVCQELEESMRLPPQQCPPLGAGPAPAAAALPPAPAHSGRLPPPAARLWAARAMPAASTARLLMAVSLLSREKTLRQRGWSWLRHCRACRGGWVVVVVRGGFWEGFPPASLARRQRQIPHTHRTRHAATRHPPPPTTSHTHPHTHPHTPTPTPKHPHPHRPTPPPHMTHHHRVSLEGAAEGPRVAGGHQRLQLLGARHRWPPRRFLCVVRPDHVLHGHQGQQAQAVGGGQGGQEGAGGGVGAAHRVGCGVGWGRGWARQWGQRRAGGQRRWMPAVGGWLGRWAARLVPAPRHRRYEAGRATGPAAALPNAPQSGNAPAGHPLGHPRQPSIPTTHSTPHTHSSSSRTAPSRPGPASGARWRGACGARRCRGSRPPPPPRQTGPAACPAGGRPWRPARAGWRCRGPHAPHPLQHSPGKGGGAGRAGRVRGGGEGLAEGSMQAGMAAPGLAAGQVARAGCKGRVAARGGAHCPARCAAHPPPADPPRWPLRGGGGARGGVGRRQVSGRQAGTGRTG